tara:strand:+ start:5447 stop:5704 length:258 start_codon:yes stop_codon:yes gene_type:complete
MAIGMYAVGTHAVGAPGVDFVQAAQQAVVSSPLLPDDAKMAVKDFLKESFKVLWDNLDQLLDISPPDHLLRWWDIVVEIVKTLIT